MLKQIATNGLFGTVTASVGFYGEYLQYLAGREIPYQWYMGHMSDLFLPAAMISLGTAGGISTLPFNDEFKNYENKKEVFDSIDKIVLGSSALVVAGATFVEYLDSTVGVNFDWKDVVCYTIGASAAYCVYKFSRIFEKS